MHIVGGYGDEKSPDATVQAMLDAPEVRGAVGDLFGAAVETLTIEGYKTQVVAGVNYRVKAKINGDSVVIVLHKALPHTGKPLEVKAVERGADL